jgi:hypothetical protein
VSCNGLTAVMNTMHNELARGFNHHRLKLKRERWRKKSGRDIEHRLASLRVSPISSPSASRAGQQAEKRDMRFTMLNSKHNVPG